MIASLLVPNAPFAQFELCYRGKFGTIPRNCGRRYSFMLP